MRGWTFWIGFNVAVLALLAIDLGLTRRNARRIPPWEMAGWSGLWIALSLAFGLWILHTHGREPALEFFTGYLIEKSMSADNLLVMLMIFHSFGVKERFQHRVLFWGIFGAIALRGALIGAGATLLREFHWAFYLFGAFILLLGLRLLLRAGQSPLPREGPAVRWARKHLASAEGDAGGRFFVREDGSSLRVTQLFLVLLAVESADAIFAFDSIPAVFGVTRNPFIVYSSNICAVVGLRAMYSLFAILPMESIGLGAAAILIFIGAKMLAEPWIKVPNCVSFCVVASSLAASIIAGVFSRRKMREADRTPYQDLAGRECADAARKIFAEGRSRIAGILSLWAEDEEMAKLLAVPEPRLTTGVAVTPENFQAIHKANGSPRLAEVPPDQDAMEFELHFADGVQLDILTTKAPTAKGAIARFLDKFGEGIQQVEIETSDVDRAAAILRKRFGQTPIYPATRPGAGGTRVNFFLVTGPDRKKLLIELVELRKSS